jgi:general secretion pathway protein K
MTTVFDRPSLGGERGVVLIMALLIVVLVTTVVVAVSWRFTLNMARNENRWHGSQARAYLEGGEQLARKVLRDDLTENARPSRGALGPGRRAAADG